VHASTENTRGKFPEYHRVWEDDALDVVAVFGREFEDARADDGGVGAYRAFMAKTNEYLMTLQPDARRRTSPGAESGARPTAALAATLDDGRRIRVEAVLTSPELARDAGFDAWYDARTADADVIVYSGHAGLGTNVRALAQKGVFRPRKYVIYVSNGCDTFAYVDRTLSERRSALNPDDPGGTKYMDTVSNVLGGYFHTGDETSLHLVRGLVSAASATPQTYAQLFEDVDATQVMVVTGEEDNEFVPGMLARPGTTAPRADPPTAATTSPPAARVAMEPSRDRLEGGCSSGRGRGGSRGAPSIVVGVALAATARRLLRSRSKHAPTCRRDEPRDGAQEPSSTANPHRL
jgi:hypothetical protein